MLRQILLEQDDKKSDSPDKQPDKKPSAPSGQATTGFEIKGRGAGMGGRYDKEMMKAFAQEGMDAKDVRVANLASRKQPSVLMKRLGLSMAAGETSLKKLEGFLRQAVSNHPAMKQVYSAPDVKKDNKGRSALYLSVTELSPKQGRFFIRETMHAAKSAGYFSMAEKTLYIYPSKGGVIVYPTQDDKDVWGE